MTEPTTKAAPVRPTAERMAKGGVIEAKEERGTAAKPWYAQECLIDVYVGNGTITKRQAMAGYDFRVLWYRAHGASVRAANLEGRVTGGKAEMSDSAEAAVSQLKMLAERYGSDMFSCLRGIVGMGETWSHWARARGEYPQAGRLALRMSLTRHADHLKLPEEP